MYRGFLMMELSYWEYKHWLTNVDYTVIGSGIVGLNTALRLRKRFPKAKILILEKGMLPQGASTKNAGFACFGSISEVLSDLQSHSEQEVLELVKQRFDGIQLLRETVGDKALAYQNFGGHEVFLKKDELLFEKCSAALSGMNQLLQPIFKKDCFKLTPNRFGFKGCVGHYITHTQEGQIDTGQMMQRLLKLILKKDIQLLNAVHVKHYEELAGSVKIKTDKFEFATKHLLIATNGFASAWTQNQVKPARAQVLITKPIKGLNVEGTFHLDEGYYYFRNIDNRILFGGGRNLDFNTETTTEFGQTKIVQDELERLLRETILPEKTFEIDRRWSGIMGVGHQKKPMIKQLSNRVYCGVRLGGMGIAIGSLVGKELADLV